jgi:chorismate mutase/prephenate dehydratase
MNVAPEDVLAELRRRIDAADDELHDLLMRRAALIEAVARDAGKTGVKIRPGREAAMLRRRLARHVGSLPAHTVFRFWREMFAGALTIEGGQTIAVADGEDGDRLALAREHFGPLTPMRRHRNPAQALADLERGAAQAAVLPVPGDDEDAAGGWWTALMGQGGAHRLCVIGKLPFWTRRPEGAPAGEAYVVAAMRPDESGDDRGLVALEFAADTSRARINANLAAAGFTPGNIWMKRSAGNERLLALVEVAGLVADDDARLAVIGGLDARAVVIGGFAAPLGEEL